ncbi:MAG: hypothetical protein ABIQ93_14575, partial [Saprospiraceae bacterium]
MNLHLYLQANRLFFSCLLAFALATPAVAQWDSFKLPCRPAVVDLLTWQGKVYATTQDGNVFVSADDGANWQLVIQGNGLIIHPANGALITYQNRTDGVYLETDQVGAPSSTLVPFAFTYYYTRLNISDNQVYVSNGNNLQRFESGDWQAIPTPPEFYFHECQVRGSHIWADNYAYVLHSPDLGLSWDTVAYDPHFNIGLAAAGDTLLINYFDSVQQVQVLRRSIDQGQSWTVASNVPDVVYIKSGRPFYAQDANQEHPSYSWNGLSDWQKIDADFTPSSIVFSGGAQIVGQAGGVEIKKNGQQSWGDFGIGIPTYSSVYLRQADDLLLFGGDSGPGLFKKKAEDSAWSQNSELYFASQTVQIGNQLVGCGQLGTYRAQLGGPDFKWQLLHPQTGYLFGMNGQLYLVDWQDGKIYRSTDAGSTWTQTGAAPGTDTNSLAAFDGKFFYRNGKNVLISENEGQSWTIRYTFSSGFDESYPASRMYALNGKIFLSYVTTKQVFASNDNGFTFTALTIPQSSTVGIFRLRVYGGQLFLYLGDGVLYRSSDNGQNWKTVKPPYPGFNFDPSVANHAMLVNATQMYLYDPAKGLGWVADLAELEPSPCDDIFIDMEPTGCYPNLSVIAPAGMLYEWFKDGILIQQSIYYYPQFEPKNGSIYKLVITNPMEGCTVSDEIIIIAPVADVAYTPMLPCNQEFDTLDLSGSSHTPGTVYSIFDYSGLGYQYFNQFDAGGNPSNPNPPVVRPGVYILQVSTPDGCYALDTAYIHAEIEIAITGLPTTFSACGQQSGSAGVQYSGDPALTTIGWSNGASGASISGLAPGWYSVTVSE